MTEPSSTPGPTGPAAAPAERALAPLLGLGIAAVVSGACVAVALVLPPPPTLALLIAGIVLVLGASFASLAVASRARAPLAVHGVAIAVAVAGGIVAYVTAQRSIGWVPIGNLLLVASGWGIGGAIGSRVEHAGHMLPAAAVAAAADLASVLHPSGPSNAIASSERALAVVALNVPLPGGIAAPVLGVGDLVFASIALGVASRHRVAPWGPLAGVALGAGVSVALSALFERPIPALVAMGALAVLFTPAFRTLRRVDRRTTIFSVTAAIAIAIALGIRAALSPPDPTPAPPPDAAPSSSAAPTSGP